MVHKEKQCCGCGSWIGSFFEPWIRDGKNPDPGSRTEMGKKSGSGIMIRDEHPLSFFRELRNSFLVQKYLNSLMRIRDIFDPGSGMEKFGSGILYKHSGYATL
jgi:hypothetical protein